MKTLAWGKGREPALLGALGGLCAWFNWTDDHASWLLTCIAFETGRTFSTSIKNAAGSGAVGLIQFMPATAKGLGTTTEALAKMGVVEQMTYVQAYFRPYYKRINSLEDMYFAILYPKYIGAPNDTVVFSDPTKAYRQNSGLDKDKDGKVTKAEVCAKIRKMYEQGLFIDNRLDIVA